MLSLTAVWTRWRGWRRTDGRSKLTCFQKRWWANHRGRPWRNPKRKPESETWSHKSADVTHSVKNNLWKTSKVILCKKNKQQKQENKKENRGLLGAETSHWLLLKCQTSWEIYLWPCTETKNAWAGPGWWVWGGGGAACARKASGPSPPWTGGAADGTAMRGELKHGACQSWYGSAGLAHACLQTPSIHRTWVISSWVCCDMNWKFSVWMIKTILVRCAMRQSHS